VIATPFRDFLPFQGVLERVVPMVLILFSPIEAALNAAARLQLEASTYPPPSAPLSSWFIRMPSCPI